MSEFCKCDNCPAVGRRRRGTYAPEGWLFLEAQDEDTQEIAIVYACSDACALAQWKRGPGVLGLLDETSGLRKNKLAEPGFPDGLASDLYLLPMLPLAQTDEEIDRVFSAIFDLVCLSRGTGDLRGCNTLLQWVSDAGRVRSIHLEVLLPCLRLTSTLRDGLPAWRSARDVIREELQRRDENADVLLFGLEDNPSDVVGVEKTVQLLEAIVGPRGSWDEV